MPLTVLIADDETAARHGMSKALGQVDCSILEAEDGEAAIKAIHAHHPDLVFLDINMPVKDGLAVLRELGTDIGRTEIIVVTADDAVSQAVSCMQLGATDYITKPYEIEQIRAAARRNLKRIELEMRVESLQSQIDQKSALGALVGISRPMRELFGQIEKAGKAPLDILIRGETGTGKELIARELHQASDRSDKPFVAVNTAAIQETLAESELFGHIKGAFTGADADRAGVFEQAQGGTVFLDEVGDMPLALQAKLLRVLQERTVQRVGANRETKVDVRVVSATHQDLNETIRDKQFRQDLFYRIRGVELHVPPLRERREDILLLTNFFLDRLETNTGESVPRPDSDAIDTLLRHHWPGNVRELEHVITAAAAMATTRTLSADDLNLNGQVKESHSDLDFSSWQGLPLTEAKADLVERFERHAIQQALQQSDGNISAAARTLGVHRQNLQQKMKQLNLKTDSS